MKTTLEQIWQHDMKAGLGFEPVLYANATRSIEGYTGGQWVQLGAHLMGVNNRNGSADKGIQDPVRLHADTNGCDVMTDRRSATVAVWVMTLNHAIWHYAEKGDDRLGTYFDGLWRAAHDAWKHDTTLDHNAISAFLD